MSTCNIVTTINGTDCIGDSRTTINNNFTELQKVLCALSAASGASIVTSGTSSITLSFTPSTKELQATVNPNSITTVELGFSAVETSNIKDNAITTSKLSNEGGALCMRNKIINGSFDVWQRGDVFENINGFVADRFAASRAGSMISYNSTGGMPNLRVYRSSDVPADLGFLNSVVLQRAPFSTEPQDISLLYYFETTDTAILRGRTVTLSFYVKAGTTFNADFIVPELYVSDDIQQGIMSMHRSSAWLLPTWSNFSVLQGNDVIPDNTWQRVTSTFTLPSNTTDLGLGIRYTPPVGAASADETLYITGIQLEIGESATPFEHRPISLEIAMCKRYFEKSYDISIQPGTVTDEGSVYVNETATDNFTIYGGNSTFTVNKAKTPIVQIYDPSITNSVDMIYCVSNATGVPINSTLVNQTRISRIHTVPSMPGTNLFQYHYTADAELY